MKKVQENVALVNEKLKAVKDHCLSFRFSETKTHYLMIYSEEQNGIGGVRVSKDMGKANALDKMLEKMELHWKAGFPG